MCTYLVCMIKKIINYVFVAIRALINVAEKYLRAGN